MCPFHYRGLECKSRKSRNTWSNRQIWPWSTEWSRAKANRVLPKEHTGHSKTLFQQHKRRLYTWTLPDSQHRYQIDYILCSRRWRSSIQSAKTRQGTDCGSDHELLITKFKLKLKTVGKTTRPFRYDLNQILYNYIVEVRNRLKRLDLIDRVPDELWMEVHDIVQDHQCLMNYGWRFVTLYRSKESLYRCQTLYEPQVKEMQKSKMAVWGGLLMNKRLNWTDWTGSTYLGQEWSKFRLNFLYNSEDRSNTNMHQFSSVAQSCLTLCDPMNHSTPGLPVHHQLLESTQTHVHQVGDAIQPSHPLLSPSPPAPSPSQH